MKTMLALAMATVMTIAHVVSAASSASDDAADTVYDSGWTNSANGGSGFGAWQLSVGGDGGHFIASSAGNAGGSSGDIDTDGESWGMWSTNGVAEAVRPFTGGSLSTGQIFSVNLDNGYLVSGRSVGLALRNSSGDNLWEFYFTGGDTYYTVGDDDGPQVTAVPYTGDGLTIDVQHKGSGAYVAHVTDASANVYQFSGTLKSQADQEVAQVRAWNYEAGAGGDHDLFLNGMAITAGNLSYEGSLTYLVVDTGQTDAYNNDGTVISPSPGDAFYGQDSQYDGVQPSYQDNGDGTITDLNTGLEWQQTPSSLGYTWQEAVDYCHALELGGHGDWRIPTLKELFSIGDFSVGWPYLNTTYFDIAGAAVSKDEQYWSANYYIGVTVEGGSDAAFGVNHGTGHIKAYAANAGGPMGGKHVRAVRGTSYGANHFVANGDGTITDTATGLMWSQADNGSGLDWEDALAYAESSALGGHEDWRLPNIKELQSIVDYSRSPSATDPANQGPAIDPMFSCTSITNEAGNADYPYYWSGTSARFEAGGSFYYAWYVAFGMAVNGEGEDFHGAGAVRFDTKVEGGPAGEGGERYYNYIRLVRDADLNQAPTAEAGGPYSGEVDEAVPLDGSGSTDTDGTIVMYEWDLDNDAQYDDATGVTPDFTSTETGTFTVSLRVTDDDGATDTDAATVTVSGGTAVVDGGYAIVDTGQDTCSDASTDISPPAPGDGFAGQDAQYAGHQPTYTLSGDGLTVYDNNTGLTWQQDPDIDDDGDIDVDDKLTWAELQTYPGALNAGNFGGYSDWRLPSIKELYSLIDFRGTDPPPEGSDTSGLTPFIDTNSFAFAYGDTGAGERIIDSQYASSNLYVAGNLLFGVNFADGRIKGYGLMAAGGGDKTFLVMCCRGNPDYGYNQFVDNGDGTVSDLATGLTWQQGDSGNGMNWGDALDYAENLDLGGYRDWRLPNAKELQGIVDYARSPDTTGSAAIDPLFTCAVITNMNIVADYPFYWSSTTHFSADGNVGRACYVAFGRGLGTVDNGVSIIDIHGAGCQRSDPKDGDPGDYPSAGNGPQGDVSRVFNHVRCVRGGATEPAADTDADGLTDWYEYNYVTNTTAMVADGDDDGDDYLNIEECGAGTSPLDDGSLLDLEMLSPPGSSGFVVVWPSVLGKSYCLERSTNMLADAFTTIVVPDIAATPPVNTYTDTLASASAAFYRVRPE